jgi:site-specific DNA-methyltransferase (adenine-specific)
MTKLYHGDCLEEMKQIPDGSVDMVMTSPPYDNLRTYNDTLDWGEHVWKPCIESLFRVVKQGGIVVWVVGDATIKGSETGTSFRQALYAMECGFNLHDTMIWNKQMMSQVGSPMRYSHVFEYMFVFSRGKPGAFNPIKDKPNKSAGRSLAGSTVRESDGSTHPVHNPNHVIPEFGKRFDVWNMSAEMNRRIKHPAPFPLSLATDHIISWSNEGDTILDPFMGSGTTGVACANLNRNFIGIEKDDKYFQTAKDRIEQAKGLFSGADK